jgi:hypothetical protein
MIEIGVAPFNLKTYFSKKGLSKIRNLKHKDGGIGTQFFRKIDGA